jgi:hypothetical protein
MKSSCHQPQQSKRVIASQARNDEIAACFTSRCVGQRIAQDQATFGIGIEHFDGLPGHAGQHVTGAIGIAVGHVFHGRGDADEIEWQGQFNGREERAEHAGCTAHVELHFLHAGSRLQRQAAGVEGDALADQ